MGHTLSMKLTPPVLLARSWTEVLSMAARPTALSDRLDARNFLLGGWYIVNKGQGGGCVTGCYLAILRYLSSPSRNTRSIGYRY